MKRKKKKKTEKKIFCFTSKQVGWLAAAHSDVWDYLIHRLQTHSDTGLFIFLSTNEDIKLSFCSLKEQTRNHQFK